MVGRFPGLTFGGPYRNPADLRELYDGIDIVWCLDFYDAGKNSEWLLPNRLYEALCLGKPVLALAGTATGRYVEEHGVGWTVSAPVEASLERCLTHLDTRDYAEKVKRVAALPEERYVDLGDVQRMLERLVAPEANLLSSTVGAHGEDRPETGRSSETDGLVRQDGNGLSR